MSEYEDLKTIVEANQQYNVTEHSEIHDAIDAERSQRIAGDAVVLEQLGTVNTRVTSINTSLGNEVIARTQGDLVSDGLYHGLNARFIVEWQDLTSQLSDLSIDVVNNANQLQGAIDTLAMSVEVLATNLRQETQDLFTQYDDRLEELDQRVAKYEIMLQDITMDSTQITMDNGEITLGAWTILSQAREWDLEIIASVKTYQGSTSEQINQALEDIQSQLPNEQDIINKAIEQLSVAPIIVDLENNILSSIESIAELEAKTNQEFLNAQANLNAVADYATTSLLREKEALVEQINTETAERIDAVMREADIRSLQIENINTSISEETEERLQAILQLQDGLTSEIESRIEGDLNVTTALENYKESNDNALANVMNTVEVLVTDTNSLASTVSSLDGRLVIAEQNTEDAKELAVSATEKATTALDTSSATAVRMDSVEASIAVLSGELSNKVDVVAFNSLQTEVTAINDTVTTHTSNISSINGSISALNAGLEANISAIEELTTTQEQQGDSVTQLASSVEQLSAEVVLVQSGLETKADTSTVSELSTKVTQQGNQVELLNTDLTLLKTTLDTLEDEMSTKVESTAFNQLTNQVSNLDEQLSVVTGSVTSLEGRIVIVEAGLTTKADASALNNIYTKTESDNAIAGQISSYNASLVIGGTNLLNNTMILSNTSDTYRGGKIYRQSRTASQTDTQDFGISMSDLDAGDYTLSFDIKSSINVPSNASNLSYFYGPNNTTKIVTSQGYTATNADGRTEKQVTTSWQRIWITWTQSSATESKGLIINRIYGNGLDYTVDIANVKFEKGNKATAWTPADSDIQSSISANASAIVNTNTNVSVLDGKVTSLTEDITYLNNEVSSINGDIVGVTDTISVLTGKVTATENELIAQSSSINKLDASIRANTASDNLIPNPTFDSAYDQMGYTVVPSTNSEVPVNCPYKFVAKLNSRDNVPTIEDIACTAGDVYELSVYAACAEGTHNFNLMIFEKDSKDGSIVNFPASGLAPSSVWTKKVWRWTVPAGTTFFKPVLQLDTFDNSTTWYVTNWTVNNISAAAEAQSTADATANTLVATNATVTQQGNQIVANTASIQSAESRIATNESSIQNIQNTYATKDSVGSLAQTALESVWQNDITEAVKDISVGGVNLLSNTTYLNSNKPPQVLGGSDYYTQGLNVSYASASANSESYFVVTSDSTERFMRIQTIVSINDTLKPNNTYTYSLKIRGGAKPVRFRVIVQIAGNWTDLLLENIEFDNSVYSVHGCTFTIPNDATAIIISLQSYSNNAGEAFALINSSMKLEQGNVITAWSPSTSDVQAQIDATSGALNSLTTTVTVLDGKVSSQASSITQLETNVAGNTAAIAVQGNSLNGVLAEYTIKLDVNGLVAGIGVINTGTSSAIGINADYFYIGAPSGGKKPFMVLTSAQTIGGVTYPAGTWIDVALIANATIGTAHIANAAITTAKIADLAVTNAKINDLNATKITAGYLSADRIQAGSINASKLYVEELSAVSGNLGTLTTYKDPAQPNKARMVIQGSLITVYDDNNVMRVRMGLW